MLVCRLVVLSSVSVVVVLMGVWVLGCDGGVVVMLLLL